MTTKRASLFKLPLVSFLQINETFIINVSNFFFFWCGPFLNSLLNLLQYCFCFMFSVFWLRGMWDLNSLTRDQTCTPCIGRQGLNHWTTREVPSDILNSSMLNKYQFQYLKTSPYILKTNDKRVLSVLMTVSNSTERS